MVFTGTVFGLGALVSKGLIDDGVDPFVMTSAPFLVGGVVGVAVGAARSELRPGAVAAGALLGVTNSAVPALCFNLGFEDLPAGIVTLLISLGPVTTAVVAHFTFDDEAFGALKGAGLGLAVAGVAVLAVQAESSDGGGSVLSVGIVVAGTVAAGVSGVLSRRLALRHGAEALIAPQLVVGGVVAAAAAMALGRPWAPEGRVDGLHVAAVVAMGILTVYLGFRSLLAASEIGTSGQVSVIGYLIPLYGVVGGLLLFGDELTPTLVLGAVLVLAAVALIGRGSRARPAVTA